MVSQLSITSDARHNSGRTLSSVLPLSAGVPQGTILSPLLFLLYVNDFPTAVPSVETNLFADDTSLAVSDPDPQVLCVN